jgi:hypothetical protein
MMLKEPGWIAVVLEHKPNELSRNFKGEGKGDIWKKEINLKQAKQILGSGIKA